MLRNQTPGREPMRQRLPYGKWTCADGREVLFNRRHKPIWQRRPGEGATRANADEWVRFERQEWFYSDEAAPWRSRATVAECESILISWGVAGGPE